MKRILRYLTGFFLGIGVILIGIFGISFATSPSQISSWISDIMAGIESAANCPKVNPSDPCMPKLEGEARVSFYQDMQSIYLGVVTRINEKLGTSSGSELCEALGDAPVCGEVTHACAEPAVGSTGTLPNCLPLRQTFRNRCDAEAANATNITSGACSDTGTTSTVVPHCGNGADNGVSVGGASQFPDTRVLCLEGIPLVTDSGSASGQYHWYCTQTGKANANGTPEGEYVSCYTQKTNQTIKGEQQCFPANRQSVTVQESQFISRSLPIGKDVQPPKNQLCNFPAFATSELTWTEVSAFPGATPSAGLLFQHKIGNWIWKCSTPDGSGTNEVDCKSTQKFISEDINGNSQEPDAGCTKLTKYYARPAVTIGSEWNLVGHNLYPHTSGVQGGYLSGANMIYVCNDDSKLNNGGSYEYELGKINAACPENYHPMERWELDMLGGDISKALLETTYMNGSPMTSGPRFDKVNKSSVTHWLSDNLYENNSTYGYLQGKKDLQSVSASKLRVRCVQDNGVGRDGKSELKLAGCDPTTKQAGSGLEYCTTQSNLLSEYTPTNEVGKFGYNDRNASAAVSFTGEYTCPEGFGFASDPLLLTQISDLTKGKKEIKDDAGKVVLTLVRIENGLAIFRGASTASSDYVGSAVGATGRDRYRSLRVLINSLSGDSNNALATNLNTIATSFDQDKLIPGVCIKKNKAFDDYMTKLSGCTTTKQIGTVTLCTEPAKISCLPGYHNMNYNEFKENNHALFYGSPGSASVAPTTHNFPYPFNGFSSNHPNYQNQFSNPEVVKEAYRIDSLNKVWLDQGTSVQNLYPVRVTLTNYVNGVLQDGTYLFSEKGGRGVCVKD